MFLTFIFNANLIIKTAKNAPIVLANTSLISASRCCVNVCCNISIIMPKTMASTTAFCKAFSEKALNLKVKYQTKVNNMYAIV